MDTIKDISAFEVVGPIMMGPSSSGTAGMYRIGAAARQFFPGEPSAINLKFTPRFGTGYLGCRSHFGLLAGILGYSIVDERVPQIVQICRDRGIAVTTSMFRNPLPDHALTVEVTLESASLTRRLTATSIGGGTIRVDRLNDFPVTLSNQQDYCFVLCPAQSLAQVTALLGSIPYETAVNGSDALAYFASTPAAPLDELRALAGEQNVICTQAFIPLGSQPHEPLFTTFEQLVVLSEQTGKDVAELTIEYEIGRSGRTRDAIWVQMAEQLQIMKRAAHAGLTTEIHPLYGYNDGKSGKRLYAAAQSGRTLGGKTLGTASATAMAVMEYSMALGCIVAAPTGGSAGIVPGALLTVQNEHGYSDDQMIRALFVAASVGIIMFYKDVSFSGSQGGCQGEVGVSSAMAAAALGYLGGGNAATIANAMALTMKNILGLICDPLRGCDEVPCIKRNGIGVANAFSGADMALAGITSFIPPDEVVDELLATEKAMPVSMRGCTDESCGACNTKTGRVSWATTQAKAQSVILPERE